MPRLNPGRQLAREYDVARRVQQERVKRGWSYEVLARAMTNVGCAMQPSALFKIEKGDPPRRITVEEFLAFANVFGVGPTDLLVAPEIAERHDLNDAILQYGKLAKKCRPPLLDLWNFKRRTIERFHDDSELLARLSESMHRTWTDAVGAHLTLVWIDSAEGAEWQAFKDGLTLGTEPGTGMTPDENTPATSVEKPTRRGG